MYKNFIEEFDKIIEKYFFRQKKYIKCKAGCSKCCEKGDFPFSQAEFTYLTTGYINLPPELKITIQQKIKQQLVEKRKNKGRRFEHICPFLINGECSVYEYRGIICRTFGLAYYDEENNYVRLPDCVNYGLNYSEYYDKKNHTLNIPDVLKHNLRIDKVLNSDLAQKHKVECGEIRPMLDWLQN